MRRYFILFGLAIFWVVLISVVLEMPTFGDIENPTINEVYNRYTREGPEEAGSENLVTNVILNYRGYDTLGEVTVIFTALCSVVAVLKRENLQTSYSEVESSEVKPSVITATVLALLLPFVILFSAYVIVFGHIFPGGGFQGGTILGATWIVFVLIFGLVEAMRKFPLKLRTILEASAILSFGLVGFAGLLVGANFLTFLLPGVAVPLQHSYSRFFYILLEVGIGIGCATIFTSIYYSMKREEPK